MPYKTKEARNAHQRERYARLKAEDPDHIAKIKAQQAAYYQRKVRNDAEYAARRKSDFAQWYAEFGKQNARSRKGYRPLSVYLAECEANRKSRCQYMREWGQTVPGMRATTAQSIKKRCGLTIDEYDEIYAAQDGMCRICQKKCPRYGQGRLGVDHCHKSGEFRSLLCGKCNSAIGLFEEDPEILGRAIAYLKEVGS